MQGEVRVFGKWETKMIEKADQRELKKIHQITRNLQWINHKIRFIILKYNCTYHLGS